MSVYNHVQFIGRLVDDPKFTEGAESTKDRCTFKLAIPDHFGKNPDGSDRADFLWMVCWGVTARNVKEYCEKGMEVTVGGRIRTNWKPDANDPKKGKEYIECVVESIHFGAHAGDRARASQAEQDVISKLTAEQREFLAQAVSAALGAKTPEQTQNIATADPFAGVGA
jgi:single-stranded DNA-binding protein